MTALTNNVFNVVEFILVVGIFKKSEVFHGNFNGNENVYNIIFLKNSGENY